MSANGMPTEGPLAELLAETTQEAQDAQALLEAENVNPFDDLMFSGLDYEDLPDKEWWIDGLFGPGDLGMIYGAPGSGKSFVAFDLMRAAVEGEETRAPWANRTFKRPLRVVYSTGEGRAGLKARIHAIVKHFGLREEERGRMHFCWEVPQLFDRESSLSTANFIDAVKQREPNPDLVIIDTLHTATTGANENDGRDAGVIIKATDEIRKSLGCALILVHHSNKADTGARGHTSYHGALDFQLEVRPKSEEDRDVRQVRCAKSKDGQEWPWEFFTLWPVADSVVVDWKQPGDVLSYSQSDFRSQILDVLKERPDQWFPKSSLCEAAGVEKRQALDYPLKVLEKDGLLDRSLQDESKPPGRHNPWVYRIAREEE